MGFLLVAASGLTYAAIASFLPAFYSSKLEESIDEVSQEMAETISSHNSIEEAGSAIELFEASAGVSVVILDEEGNTVWPSYSAAETTVMEERLYKDGGLLQSTDAATSEAVSDEVREEPIPDEAIEEAEKPEVSASDEMIEGMGQAALEGGDSASVNAELVAGTWDSVITGYLETVEIAESSDGSSMLFVEQNEDSGTVNSAYFLSKNPSENVLEYHVAGDGSAIKHFELEVDGKSYVMLVLGGMQPVNQAVEILHQIFPYILGLAFLVAILFALAGSFYLTAPVVRMSKISRKMASLDFSDTYQGKRTDEVGILGRNLNEMSSNLSNTLQDLQQANAKLKSDIELERELEKKRIAFFSAVSHELKTPITILKGHLTGMLQGIGAYRDRDYYLGRSLDTTDTMEGMVQELLTVSRIESKEFTTSRVDLAELLRLQLAEMTELIDEKGLELCLKVPEHLETEVNRPMMEKVLRNLLSNAIRYTPAGEKNEIRIEMKPMDAGNASGQAWCSVENTGVHIPEESLAHLFEAFYRVESSRNRKTGGSGLGLYIVRMALEQHGASYGIENTRDGVRFCFSL